MNTVETLARGDDSRLAEPRRFVVRDPRAFAAIWAAHAGRAARPPVVDFESRMVAAIFAGERPTPGYSVEITGTRRDDSALVVLADERQPDTAQVVAQVLVSPFHIVTLARDDGEVRFDPPDAGGYQTIVFKPPSRRTPALTDRAEPPPPLAAPVPASRAVANGEVSAFTGLTPRVAASLAYLAGPFSGALLLATEPASRFVRFHAWQSIVGLGLLGMAALVFLVLSFALLIVSPTAFWIALWIAAATGASWVGLWAFCVVNAYRGGNWTLPVVGGYAARKC
jgi:uncharacterized membrane protein